VTVPSEPSAHCNAAIGGNGPLRPNVLFVTLDQFRGDSLGCAGHPLVRTPALDHLAAHGVRLANHYSQAAPCAPGRAALYTGMYQMNNRVVANGTPLDASFDTIGLAARRAGYQPVMFGYTDQAVDPRIVDDPDDPRLRTYEGVLPGFDCVLDLAEPHAPWLSFLNDHGHHVFGQPGSSHHGTDAITALFTEHERPAELSMSTFTTNAVIDWLDDWTTSHADKPWFAHVSYLRPHPPYSAAGHFAEMYSPGDCPPPLPTPPVDARHPLHDSFLANRRSAAPADPAAVQRIRAQYYGMISEVDRQLGRLWVELADRNMWDNTVIVVTADHGEQLGDHGLIQKLGWFSSSYHIVGIWRDPSAAAAHGTVVEAFTENIDIMPTLCEAMGVGVPAQCDGRSLRQWVNGATPTRWRDAAYMEWDWRDNAILAAAEAGQPPSGSQLGAWPDDRRLEHRNLAVRRTGDAAFVQFGDGSWRCYDLAADPTWMTEIDDPQVVLAHAQAMLVWRSSHLRRELTNTLLTEHGPVSQPAP
jgi:arylsulfatase A-like enzyme